jgi:hypothetical protein
VYVDNNNNINNNNSNNNNNKVLITKIIARGRHISDGRMVGCNFLLLSTSIRSRAVGGAAQFQFLILDSESSENYSTRDFILAVLLISLI